MMVEVTRDFNARRINTILNDPAVRPWVADAAEGVIDLTKAVADERNYCLVGEHGACMLFFFGAGLYEVHTQITRAGRGEWAKAFVCAARDYMFTRTPGVEGVTRVPRGHIGARALSLIAGFELEFTRPKECTWIGKTVDVDIYRLSVLRWTAVNDRLIATGEWWHELLNEAAARAGIADPPHADDPNHNRYVGAAIDMVLGGQLKKGVNWYNRWAVLSRHAVIRIVQEDPPIIALDHGFTAYMVNDRWEIGHHEMAPRPTLRTA